MKRGGPLKRTTPLRPGANSLKRRVLARASTLPKVSAKRKAQAPTRAAVCAAVRLRDGDRCRAAGLAPRACGGPLDVHEVVPRSAWSAGYLVEANCMVVCRLHHDWIGDYPYHAHALGLHGYSWERPA